MDIKDVLSSGLLFNTQNPMQTETPSKSSRELHMERVLEEIFSISNIEMKSDLTQKQINPIAKALLFSDKFNVGILNDFAHKIMVLQVSKNRQGRKEMVQSTNSYLNDDNGMDFGGIRQRLLG